MTIRQRAEKKYEKNRRQLIVRQQQNTRSPAPAGPAANGALPATPRPRSPSTASQSSTSSPAAASVASSSVLLTPTPSPDREALIQGAVAAYLSQWSNTNVNIWWSVFDAAAILSASSGMPGGSLTLALKAVTLMALAQSPEARCFDLLRSARRQYELALKSLNGALQDPKLCLDDATFMTLILTAACEVRSYIYIYTYIPGPR